MTEINVTKLNRSKVAVVSAVIGTLMVGTVVVNTKEVVDTKTVVLTEQVNTDDLIQVGISDLTDTIQSVFTTKTVTMQEAMTVYIDMINLEIDSEINSYKELNPKLCSLPLNIQPKACWGVTITGDDEKLAGNSFLELDEDVVNELNQRYYNTEPRGETDEKIIKEYKLSKQILMRKIEGMPTKDLIKEFEKTDFISIKEIESILTEIKMR